MGFRPMFETYSDPGKFYGNAQVFATEAEAKESAEARRMRWTMCKSTSVEETNEPVTYRFENGTDLPIRTHIT